MSVFGIHCIVDPFATLAIRDNGGGDIALQTERFDPDSDADNISHMTVATLRSRRGGGRYDTGLAGEDYAVNTLRGHFIDLRSAHAAEKNVIPDFATDFRANDWDVNTPVEILSFPSDDGAAQSFHLLKKGDHLGVKTSHGDKYSRAGRDVTVWLGNMTEQPVLDALWSRAVVTHQHYQTYDSHPGFVRQKLSSPEPS